MSTFEVGLNVTVVVEINDENAITRCVENQDEEGRPQPDERGGSGWRNIYYRLLTREQVLEHLAYNASVNGIDDASRLDGWADLERGVVTMHVDHAALDWVSP